MLDSATLVGPCGTSSAYSLHCATTYGLQKLSGNATARASWLATASRINRHTFAIVSALLAHTCTWISASRSSIRFQQKWFSECLCVCVCYVFTSSTGLSESCQNIFDIPFINVWRISGWSKANRKVESGVCTYLAMSLSSPFVLAGERFVQSNVYSGLACGLCHCTVTRTCCGCATHIHNATLDHDLFFYLVFVSVALLFGRIRLYRFYDADFCLFMVSSVGDKMIQTDMHTSHMQPQSTFKWAQTNIFGR